MKVTEPGLRRPKNDSDPSMLPRIRRLIGADSQAVHRILAFPNSEKMLLINREGLPIRQSARFEGAEGIHTALEFKA